ncbi:MAG: translation initiation factor IF-2 [Candidatus Magasanikbacteria bacterium CG10_big_fil_rev_8_21_14_0_10_40_10]|uniref:Translation initiation factor IF-2 n=1 Tax=Candidatus Magasanikbacteria bacterium CG10_big_fil_rev_8_21_14_0_10_40_10 TaxID=1974648 RepID=A0A2M6W3A6_9BACT|nr:MAG: translation initiation factor IF-2 [Candidatus Magasanikbacteria bacterium CG10_big_fil_rev_8_21_14_0_10_40_10]
MNVTELARKLRTHPKKLLEILPEFGFDIGARAIKVDERIAGNIIKSWRRIKKELERREEIEKEKQKELEKKERQETGASVKIPARLTVSELADILDIQTTRLIMELMKNGILAAKNENIDRDTAVLIAQDLGYQVVEETEEDKNSTPDEDSSVHVRNLQEILANEKTDKRPPVVVVVGHVDHGKTKLLDAIRHADVVSKEAGGITQHIGAYQVVWKDPKTQQDSPLTFIDTPGHEAFTVMRSRGAKVADIAILVVAADDSVKPQTVESINIIKAAKIPMVVAINKIDKPEADVEKVKVDLSQREVVCEEWGGQVPMVEISAKQNLNIDKLLDMLLLVDQLNAEDIQSNPNRPAAGTIIEAHVNSGQGNVATLLVQTGTLRPDDPLVVNGRIFGKVRAMKNDRGEDLKEAGPSTPVRILGFKVLPQVGDVLDVGSAQGAEKVDVKAQKSRQSRAERHSTIRHHSGDEAEDKSQVLNLVVKADTLGSLEAVISSLSKIEHEVVGVRVVGKGLGNITADDVGKAQAANALICAFNVSAPFGIQDMMREKGLKLAEYKIIYDLTDFIKAELGKMIQSETIKVDLGVLEIKAIFHTEKNKMIIGGLVKSGKIELNALARVIRGEEEKGVGVIKSLQIGKQNEKSVPEGTECGAEFEGKTKLIVGDRLEAYKEEIIIKKANF